MSSSNWRKQWQYDSRVKVPRTTKWRRSIAEKSERTIRFDDNDSRNFKSEMCLEHNISPVKRQKIDQQDLDLEYHNTRNSHGTDKVATDHNQSCYSACP